MRKDARDMLAELASEESLPDKEKVGELTEAVNQYLSLERRKAELAEESKEVTGTILKCLREYIPEIMGEIGVASIETEHGVKVKCGRVVRARLNKEDYDKGFKWLKENGLEGLIKKEVVVKLDRKDPKHAALLDKLIKTLDSHMVDFDIRENVHPATLQSAIREEYTAQQAMEAEGRKVPKKKQIPEDLFHLWVGPEAKVDLKKARKENLL